MGFSGKNLLIFLEMFLLT